MYTQSSQIDCFRRVHKVLTILKYIVKFEALINLKYKYVTACLFKITFNFVSFLANYTNRFKILCNSQDTHRLRKSVQRLNALAIDCIAYLDLKMVFSSTLAKQRCLYDVYGPPRWCSGRAFPSHAGFRGSISGRDRPKSLKRVVRAPRSGTGVSVTSPQR